MINDGTASWAVQKPFSQLGGINRPIANSIKVNGDVFVGDDNGNSHGIYLRFRKDTTDANAVNILAVPNDGSYEDRQAGIGFLRMANNEEICAFMGTGESPWSSGLNVYNDRLTYRGAELHYIKASYRNGKTVYQQDDTGLIFQAGYATIQAGADGSATKEITLPHPMKDTNYVVFAACDGNIGAELFYSGTAKSTTKINLTIFSFPANYQAGVNWYVIGMGA